MTTPGEPDPSVPSPYGAPTGGGQPPYGASPYESGGAYGGNQLAHWGKRVGAFLLDSVIVAVPVLVLVLIGAAIGGGGGAALIILGYLVAFGFGIYNQVFRQGTTGQTLGKQVLDIKLLREADGQVMGPGMCFLRQLVHIVDSIACYVGWLWPLWDNKRQTFADKIMSTVVIEV